MADQQPLALPDGLSRPARRALADGGYARREQLAEISEAGLGQSHGSGPNALGRPRRTIAARGLAFADERSKPGGGSR